MPTFARQKRCLTGSTPDKGQTLVNLNKASRLRCVFNWREKSFVVVGTEAVHRRELANADLFRLKLGPLHPHYGEQRGWDGNDAASPRDPPQLGARNDVGADDPTTAWRTIAGG